MLLIQKNVVWPSGPIQAAASFLNFEPVLAIHIPCRVHYDHDRKNQLQCSVATYHSSVDIAKRIRGVFEVSVDVASKTIEVFESQQVQATISMSQVATRRRRLSRHQSVSESI